MKYASQDGTVVEWIWNSRDGVTPFVVKSRCGKEMTHVQWNFDIRIRSYTPLPGERVFVDATEALLRPSCEEVIKRNHPTAGGQVFENLVAQEIQRWLQPGAPFLITGEQYGVPLGAISPMQEAIGRARQNWQAGTRRG
jgi:hypothetical protein